MLQGKDSVYDTEAFTPILALLGDMSGKQYGALENDPEVDKSFRIVADHVRAATFILGDPKAVMPSNVGAGYVLRRLIRRAVRHGKKLGIEGVFLAKPAEVVIQNYQGAYPELAENRERILRNSRVKKKSSWKPFKRRKRV